MREEYLCPTPLDTEELGAELARRAAKGNSMLFALYGDLGAGKTAFVRGAAKALGENDAASPTFSVLHEYDSWPSIFHFDLYRLAGPDDLEAVGFFDALDRGGILFVEWPERAEGFLPLGHVDVQLQVLDDGTRKIFVNDPQNLLSSP